jgi:drebrin-like protein
VPSNYLVEVDEEPAAAAAASAAPAAPAAPSAAPAKAAGATATALYDYEAGEDNELSFPENATIENVVSISSEQARSISNDSQTFPDEDWWHGEYQGRTGLFPANYTKLDD